MVRFSASHIHQNQSTATRICKSFDFRRSCSAGRHICRQGDRQSGNLFQRSSKTDLELGTDCHYFSTFDEIENYLLENCIPGDLFDNYGSRRRCKHWGNASWKIVIHIFHRFLSTKKPDFCVKKFLFLMVLPML